MGGSGACFLRSMYEGQTIAQPQFRLLPKQYQDTNRVYAALRVEPGKCVEDAQALSVTEETCTDVFIGLCQ